MTTLPPAAELDSLWSRHHARWRDGAQVASQWSEAAETDPKLLRSTTRGPWWELLDRLGITLLVTREYEHLAMALSVDDGQPAASFMRLPHPSGLVADRARGVVHVASTRNPNQLFTFAPVERTLARADMPPPALERRPLVPVGTRFYPGALYMHDLALIGGELHANSVGQNAIVRLGEHGATRVWWPRAVEDDAGVPDCSRNYLQLNSIAGGETLARSCFSASSARISARRPGHRNYPVDGRGVIFDGATREPLAGGLTRPHSARFDAGELWVDNSGYGEVGAVAGGAFEPLARLGSWTRGLVFCDDVVFVGVSRVIPRYRQYAPGLRVEQSVCGVVALERGSGAELARLTWPYGNQIFALDWLPRRTSGGFPFAAGRRASSDSKHLFYSFLPSTHEEFQHT